MIKNKNNAKEISISEKDWKLLISQTPERVRIIVAQLIKQHAADCVESFYQVLLKNSDAAPFLSNEIVDTRLRASLERWLTQLFSYSVPDARLLVKNQEKIGAAHARIQVPIHVVMHGARLIKKKIRTFIYELDINRSQCFDIITYTEDMIDIAIEVISISYVKGNRNRIESNESFRIVSLNKDINLERETQRSALLEWGQSFLLNLFCGGGVANTLSSSSFGIWLRHKGSILFQGSSEINIVSKSINYIDNILIPKLLLENPVSSQEIKHLQGALDEIHYMMDQVFKTAEAVENGRDPLTKTLSRRFLPTILSREISISMRSNVPFSIIMIDIDHFKSINDTFGHIVGDSVLGNIAKVLLEQCRISDFVFRYGGEEFLVLLTETQTEQATQIAERIRMEIEKNFTLTVNGKNINVTISCGITKFSGHPDYHHLIAEADRALYLAKAAGRNRFCVT